MNAFPVAYTDERGYPRVEGGMTLRDYFAAAAMQSIMSTLHQGIRPVDIASMCKDAYIIADAMLKQRGRL
jgi:hypothetical protein